MKAIICTKYGSPDVLQLVDVPKPTPKANEILVKVVATTVTTGDAKTRAFVVPSGFWLPARLALGLRGPRKPILGHEFAGDVEAVGSAVTQFKVGDAVFGFNGVRFGAHAEYMRVPAQSVVTHKPAQLSYAEAAAIPFGGLTALDFWRKAGIGAGQKVLVYGASGSVGTAAVQLAKHFGAEVTGVCSGRNVELVRGLGADHVIDYTQSDFTQATTTYDIIFDTLGKLSFEQCKPLLTPQGRYINLVAGLPDFLKTVITGIRGGQKLVTGIGSEKLEDLVLLKTLAETGKFKAVLDDTQYTLPQTADAHRLVDSGRKRGAVIINVAG